MNHAMEKVIAAAEAGWKPEAGDYVEDGLVFCGICHTPRQTGIELFGAGRIVPCLCKCREVAKKEEERRAEEVRRQQEIARLRVNGLQDKSLLQATFNRAEDSKNVQRAWRYTECWKQMKADNTGLLLWGGVGTGKTFAAACIANALIDQGVPALVTSFPKVLAAITGMFGDERVNYLRSLDKYDLLVIDDLGVERQSEFAVEQVFEVIDSRYKAKKPLIITTNLTLPELKNPPSTGQRRIYDRILAMCVPIAFDGESRRKREASDKLSKAAALLG